MFRKVFLILFLVLGLNANNLFVGVNAGIPITTPKYSDLDMMLQSMFPETGIGYSLGINVGYKSNFGPNNGLKYYLEYIYSESYSEPVAKDVKDVKADINSQLITLNVDYYYNFTNVFGVYAGLGIGYVSYNPKYTMPQTPIMPSTIELTKGGFALPLNLGLSFNINKHHGLSLGAKIPLIGCKYKVSFPGADNASVKLSTYIVSVGYNYTF